MSYQLKEKYYDNTSLDSSRQNVAEAKKTLPSHLFFREILLVTFVISLYLYFSSEKPLEVPPSGGQLKSSLLLPKPNSLDSISFFHRVKKGETLDSIMSSYGFSNDVARALYSSMKMKKDFSEKLKINQDLKISLNNNPEYPEVEFQIDAAKKITFYFNTGSYQSKITELPITIEKITTRGVIKNSFAASIEEMGISYALIDDVVDLFSASINFHRDLREGDSFVLVYNKQTTASGEIVREGPIEAALLEVDKKPHYAVRYIGRDKIARYYDEKGEVLGNSFLRYPLKFSRISSYFSKSRFHPVLKRKRAHNGVDFAAPTGTPVRAVADARVIYAGRKGPNGLLVKLQHGKRYSTAYAHLSKISKGLRRGTGVRRGQIIGAVGATGRATGPHLHYAFYDNGRFVDPLKIKLPSVVTDKSKIDPAYLKKMLGRLD